MKPIICLAVATAAVVFVTPMQAQIDCDNWITSACSAVSIGSSSAELFVMDPESLREDFVGTNFAGNF